MIGANGGGKTSLLDVFSLLAASASGSLNKTMSGLGGLDGNLTNLNAAEEDKARFMAFDLAMSVPNNKSMKYHFQLMAQGVTYEISEETLTQPLNPGRAPMKFINAQHGKVRYWQTADSKKMRYLQTRDPKEELISPNWEYDSMETALSQIPRMFQPAEELRKRLASSTHYHVLDVSRRAPVRLPQQMRDAKLPGRDGEDLVSCLYTLRETEPDRFQTIEDSLRAVFPRFERLGFPPVAAGTLAMTWKDTTSKHPFYMHQLSEGTLRFLWLATLLQSPGLTAVTLIDEPEVSLHPELLSLLADLMREASERTQLIVATHADRFVRFLKPSEVLTIDLNDQGAAEIHRADELDMDRWLEEYTLDEVWRMGPMGGRS